MEESNNTPGLATLVGRMARTGLGALRNRGELFAVEWRLEKARLLEMIVCTVGLLLLGMMALAILTAIVVFLFPREYRLWVAAVFALLYFTGAVVAWLSLRTRLKQEPFEESLAQVKRDAVWLDSLR